MDKKNSRMDQDKQLRPGSHPIALTIAGFDPGSGAGITADLKTFAAHRMFAVACISALTVQSTQGVRAVEPVAPGWIRRTLDCLAEDMALAGVKIGMLGSSGVVREVGAFLAENLEAIPRQRIVLDPVLRSSSGAPLLDPDGVHLLGEELLPRVGWITPNLEELAVLAQIDPVPAGRAWVEPAALRLRELAAQRGNKELNVVVTGGHLSPPDDFLLTAVGERVWISGEEVITYATHGTGCAFSSAVLCELISGRDPLTVVVNAKAYVTQALRSAYPVGRGKGPMHHLFPFDPL